MLRKLCPFEPTIIRTGNSCSPFRRGQKGGTQKKIEWSREGKEKNKKPAGGGGGGSLPLQWRCPGTPRRAPSPPPRQPPSCDPYRWAGAEPLRRTRPYWPEGRAGTRLRTCIWGPCYSEGSKFKSFTLTQTYWLGCRCSSLLFQFLFISDTQGRFLSPDYCCCTAPQPWTSTASRRQASR